MLKIAIGFILVLTCMQAQPYQDLLLPQGRHIVGVVVDPEGRPVVEAGIDHSDDRQHAHQTDSEGKFELDTRAPVLVVRKAGFRSELVRTQNATWVRVTLKKLSESRVFPTCPNTRQYDGIDGWEASFQFPRTLGVEASPQTQDIDYGARTYYVRTKHGAKGIMHGSGPMWSFGIPLDRDVWRSVTYEELTFNVAGRTIIDARGQLPNGNRWRTLGMFGESASYSDMDEATAKILDQFLDSACLRSAPRR